MRIIGIKTKNTLFVRHSGVTNWKKFNLNVLKVSKCMPYYNSIELGYNKMPWVLLFSLEFQL